MSQPSKFKQTPEFLEYFFPALTGMVGYWATLSLNIPDFTRYARSQKAQVIGQAIGLPPAMTLFAFVGVVVTSATSLIFGQLIWDPVELAGKFQSPILVTVALGAVVISTLATNIAANIISPANDFSNLMPTRIDFRKGGIITGILGVCISPWKLVADPTGYIFTWLIAYSSLLGPIGGIMIVDYYFIRKKNLDVQELYRPKGKFWYTRGFNWRALVALMLGITPSIPGFLSKIGYADSSFGFKWFNLVFATNLSWTNFHWVNQLYNYAWFVGFFTSGIIYWAWMALSGSAPKRVKLRQRVAT